MLSRILFVSLLLIQVYSYGDDCLGDPECLDYAKALNKAKYPSVKDEIHTLKAIRPNGPRLNFDESGRVLLTRVDLSTRFNKLEGEEFTTDRQGWYTVAPDLKNACSQPTKETKLKRVLQLLGLPPNKNVDVVYEVYVPIDFIFRPCPDPEIYDSQCVSEIPVYNLNSTNKEAPWYCPSDNEEVIQLGENYLNVKNEHFKWMCQTWQYNYGSTETYRNYPWTGLGYTYDWGSATGIGLSEFIVDTGAEVVIKKRSTIEDYCRRRGNIRGDD